MQIIAQNDIIDCKDGDLTTPSCSMNINKIIQKENSYNSWVAFFQDLIWWVIFFIWIFVTITLVVSWLLYIFAGADEKQAEKWKLGIKYSIIWLILVLASYLIVKVVVFIAW